MHTFATDKERHRAPPTANRQTPFVLSVLPCKRMHATLSFIYPRRLVTKSSKATLFNPVGYNTYRCPTPSSPMVSYLQRLVGPLLVDGVSAGHPDVRGTRLGDLSSINADKPLESIGQRAGLPRRSRLLLGPPLLACETCAGGWYK